MATRANRPALGAGGAVIEIRRRKTGAVMWRIATALLVNADLRGLDLTDAELRGVFLSGCDLREATLTSADLTGAKLRRTDFRRANLSRVILVDQRLLRTKFQGANLRAAT
jgi:uncharacterized protein YjbI with pentapeptide repeats